MLQGPASGPEEAPAGTTAEAPAQPAAADAPGTERYPQLPAAHPAAPTTGGEDAPAGEASGAKAETVEVSRARFEALLSSEGATLRAWALRTLTDRHGDPIHLLAPGDVEPAAATPFRELGLGDLSQQIWRVEQRSDVEVRFAFARQGVTLRKTYQLAEDGYDFRLRVDVRNGGASAIAPAFLVEWPIQERTGNDFREQNAAALHDGKLEITPLASLGTAGFIGSLLGRRGGEPVELPGEIDWAGVQTPYFLSALFPDQPSAAHGRFVSLEPGRRGAIQIYFDPVTLLPGQEASREYRAYLGPKQVEILEAFAPSAVASVDLGWSFLAPMTRFFVWLLSALYSFIPNYGVAIILLTILVRVVTAPLTLKQMKSMERMRKLQPKLKEIQEKYADDRPKQSEAMMSLYRQEGVNPLGGCFPMLLQLPVFIGLFYALRSSFHLRQAPFVGWIDDLSAPDLLFTLPGLELPVRVLPLLMGVSMVVQQKLTPMQADPTQARMMMILMPIMMLAISYSFPSGLVLYWMMSNVLAIGHQLWIGRHMGLPAPAREA